MEENRELITEIKAIVAESKEKSPVFGWVQRIILGLVGVSIPALLGFLWKLNVAVSLNTQSISNLDEDSKVIVRHYEEQDRLIRSLEKEVARLK